MALIMARGFTVMVIAKAVPAQLPKLAGEAGVTINVAVLAEFILLLSVKVVEKKVGFPELPLINPPFIPLTLIPFQV